MGKFLHSLIAKQNVVVCEFTAPGMTFQAVDNERIKEVLESASAGQPRKSFPQGDWIQSFFVDGNVVYMVLTSSDVPKDVAQGFLTKLKGDFSKAYGSKLGSLGPHSLDKIYGKKLKEQMMYAEKNPEELSKLEKIKGQIAETKGVMQENVRKAVQRGEKLDELQKNTENLATEAQLFEKRAGQVKHKEQWKNFQCMILVFGVFILVGIVLFFSICGGIRCVS